MKIGEGEGPLLKKGPLPFPNPPPLPPKTFVKVDDVRGSRERLNLGVRPPAARKVENKAARKMVPSRFIFSERRFKEGIIANGKAAM